MGDEPRQPRHGYGQYRDYQRRQGTGSVFGGYVQDAIPGTATGNTVTIKGSPTFGASTSIAGGFNQSPHALDDLRTGNTLNLHSPVTVRWANNFENWNFFLPSTMGNGGTMLTVTNGTTDLGTNANVNVGIEGSSFRFASSQS